MHCSMLLVDKGKSRKDSAQLISNRGPYGYTNKNIIEHVPSAQALRCGGDMSLGACGVNIFNTRSIVRSSLDVIFHFPALYHMVLPPEHNAAPPSESYLSFLAIHVCYIHDI